MSLLIFLGCLVWLVERGHAEIAVSAVAFLAGFRWVGKKH